MAPPAPPLPIGFAHRGASAECPGNTLTSFRRAIELGATALETDAWVTADGVCVLDHDGIVRRHLRRRRIAALRRNQLPHHIPALADLYALAGASVDVSLDVKDPDAAGPAVAEAVAAGAAGRLWLCGSGPRLVSWRGLSDAVRLVESTRFGRGLEARIRSLAGAGVDAVNLHWRGWTAARVAAVHGAGLLAFAWDLQTPEALTGTLALGVDAVYSDHVATMVAAIRVRTSGCGPAARS